MEIYRPELDLASRIYLSPPHLNGTEMEWIKRALESNWVAPVGPMIHGFERTISELCQTAHGLAVNSGTAALHLALRAVGVRPGDTVLCSTFTFVACANPILYLGAKPVFVDSEERTWNVDPELIADELKRCTRLGRDLPRAIVFADIYGQCADGLALRELSRRYEIPLVEDAAEALGARYRGHPAGSFGDIAALSFNGNKIITTSGGGMVLSNNRDWIQQAEIWATQARTPGSIDYLHCELGYNYRLSNVLAAIGLAQLPSLSERIASRQRIFEAYYAALGSIPGITFMPQPIGFESTRWLTCLLIDETVTGVTAHDVCRKLTAQRIDARPLWTPLHFQQLYQGCRSLGGSVSERLAKSGLCLPSGSNLRPEQQHIVIAAFRNALKRCNCP